ncbi:MAG: class I SAM-dependent methyltransferase [Bacteroidetes bacterium]|nr:class I SAM-dependent methyltransferase [Bacteroidota bacterium]MCW5895348.1 class I SAM-dependent methyltransferase [Bacteroidota bacterium]
MFSNLINPHDLVVLFEKIRERGNAGVLRKVFRSEKNRVRHSWSHTNNVPAHWWDIPAVEQRCNLLITGDRDTEPYVYVANKYFTGRGGLNALSLGCGGGGRELKWLATGSIKCLDAYDISQERIAHARAEAAESGFGECAHFHVADVFDLNIAPESYDVVLLESSLHHFKPVRRILESVNRWLKPAGYVIVNEFVGPSRFQWSDRQLEIVNGILAVIPERYRTTLPSGNIKRKVHRPGRLSMYLNDPSEAAESALIQQLLREMLEIVEWKPYGGTLLPLVFKNIAHHFVEQDRETVSMLKFIFDIEDELLRRNEIDSDYIYAVCRKRQSRK